MGEIITGAVIALCFFFVPIWAYRRGIQDGLALSQGKAPEPIATPLQAFERVTSKAQTQTTEQDLFIEGFQNLMSYDGTKQLQKNTEK